MKRVMNTRGDVKKDIWKDALIRLIQDKEKKAGKKITPFSELSKKDILILGEYAETLTPLKTVEEVAKITIKQKKWKQKTT